MDSDFDEQRFRWVHPERHGWHRYRLWAGAGAIALAGLGGVALARAGFTLTPPGPEPELVECPGHAACNEVLSDGYLDLPDTAVVETAVHNRLVRGLTAHEAQLTEAMTGRILIGQEGRPDQPFEATVIEADGAYVTTHTLLQDLTADLGLEVESEAAWTRAMPHVRLPVEERVELPDDFPMRVDVHDWVQSRAQESVDAYSIAVEQAYAEATKPIENASLLEWAAWYHAHRNWTNSIVALGLLAASGVLGGLFLFANQAHRRRQDRHVRLTRHRLEEVSVEPASVVKHPQVVDVLGSIALVDASERDVAGFIARLGRDGHVLSAAETRAFADGIQARIRATDASIPLDPETRRAMDALRHGSHRQSG